MTMVARDFQDVDGYAAAYRERAGEPRWLRALRRGAWERFTARGFPSPREEDWKYTNVAPILRTPFSGRAEDGAPVALDRRAAAGMEDLLPHGVMSNRLTFVNGRLDERSSTLSPAPDGTWITSLGETLDRAPGVLESYLGMCARSNANGFVALNTALFADGALVHLPRGAALAEPIVLAFVMAPASEARMANPRVLLVAEEDSHATVVEAWMGLAGQPYLVNAVSEIIVCPGATVEHYRLQLESSAGFHVGNVGMRLLGNGSAVSYSISLGGALVRNDITAALEAEGCECRLNGLYLARGKQHVDHHTRVEHFCPHGSSRELYDGILDGKARGVFNGKIIVHPGAQKTDAHQTNKNLLLSEQAVVDAKPQLEIFANDVKCTHGAAIGRLDDEALFYLRSRGLDREAARSLLTYAFATEALDTIVRAPLRSRADALVRGWLREAPA
jgi:Fe-S cluster assembly protein SufD